MELAGGAHLENVLGSLAAERPIFHSEADFQLALAWQIRLAAPTCRVRLETRPLPGIHLDLMVSAADGSSHTALELKYLTRRWEGEVDGEPFTLKNHGAQDIRAYDVVHDLVRIEKITASIPNCSGAVICLSNDPMYWTAPGRLRATNADAFRLYSGRVLSGALAWREGTGGTMKGRESSHSLRGTYSLDWSPYSTLPGRGGQFKQLIVPVASAG